MGGVHHQLSSCSPTVFAGIVDAGRPATVSAIDASFATPVLPPHAFLRLAVYAEHVDRSWILVWLSVLCQAYGTLHVPSSVWSNAAYHGINLWVFFAFFFMGLHSEDFFFFFSHSRPLGIFGWYLNFFFPPLLFFFLFLPFDDTDLLLFYWRSCDFFFGILHNPWPLYTCSQICVVQVDKSTLCVLLFLFGSVCEAEKNDQKKKKKNCPFFLFFFFSFFVLFSCYVLWCKLSMRLWSFFYFFSRLDSITVRLSCPQYSSGSLPVGSCQASFVCEQSWWLRFTLSFLLPWMRSSFQIDSFFFYYSSHFVSFPYFQFVCFPLVRGWGMFCSSCSMYYGINTFFFFLPHLFKRHLPTVRNRKRRKKKKFFCPRDDHTSLHSRFHVHVHVDAQNAHIQNAQNPTGLFVLNCLVVFFPCFAIWLGLDSHFSP